MVTKQVIAGRDEKIRNIVLVASKPAPPRPPRHDTTPLPPTVEGDFRYINVKHDDTNNIDTVLHLGLNDDLIWPGSLIQGSQVNDFVYIPITLPRAPIKISISAEGSSATGASISGTVPAPSLSALRQGIANVLKRAIGPATKLPARVDFTKEEVFSESDMNAKFGAAVSYGAGNLQTDFSWDSQKQMTRLIAKYTQVYFTVDVDTPASPARFFDPTAPVESIQAAMPPGSMPLYVSSVSYGMMAMICIETNHSAEVMKMALDAAYEGGVDVKVHAEFTSKEILQSSKMKILVYGGSTAGLDDIEMGYEGFMKVIAASKTYSPDSPGVPISYRFRNLLDNTLTFIALTSQYTLRQPLRIKQKVKVSVDRMQCTLSDDEGVNNDADMDRFNISLAATNALLEKGAVKQVPIQLPDPMLYAWASPGDVTVKVGYVWEVGRSKVITFDTDPDLYDFDKATLTVNGYGREYDVSSKNEHGTGSIVLTGDQFFENGGVHKFPITSADFIFDVYVTLTLED